MRIISKFKDYYDCGMSYGFDKDFHYVRDTEIVPGLSDVFSYRLIRPPNIMITECDSSGLGIIGFCGEYFPFVTHFDSSGTGPRIITYKAEVIDKYHIDHLKFYKAWLRKESPLFRELPRLFNSFFSRKCPIFQIGRHWCDGCRVYLNPNLSLLEFQKVYPPFQAYQKIRMFLGSFAEPEKPLPKISNNDMIESKGFDLKSSFRKGKG